MLKILHNPRCSKSRQTLALLEENNVPVEIIRYLDAPPSFDDLNQILKLLKMKPMELLRKNEQIFKDLAIRQGNFSDNDLIKFMCQYPKLIERPIVFDNDTAVLGRPPENAMIFIK